MATYYLNSITTFLEKPTNSPFTDVNHHHPVPSGLMSSVRKDSNMTTCCYSKGNQWRPNGSPAISSNKRSPASIDFEPGVGITKFLSGKCFFITGATGFLAKVLIEKLLRTAPDVDKIYVLIKAKNKEIALARLKNEIINIELFRSLQETHGNNYQAFMLRKLIPVTGNVREANMGIEAVQAEEILEKVDIIVNSASNTTFDERAKACGWQDTYVFTKEMGEMVINSLRGDIPVVIIRPSIIESTLKEPFPGWIEGNRMMDPIVMYYGKGKLTGFVGDPEVVIDVVPADIVVNATLATMAKHGWTKNSGIHIYHISSSTINPLIFQKLYRFFYNHFKSFPYIDSKGRPIHVTQMKLFNDMKELSSHVHSSLMKRTSMQKNASQKFSNITMKLVMHLANIYGPYTFYRGRFDATNAQNLIAEMSDEEKREFGFDVGEIDWEDYISNIHIPGLRRHVVKEDA